MAGCGPFFFVTIRPCGGAKKAKDATLSNAKVPGSGAADVELLPMFRRISWSAPPLPHFQKYVLLGTRPSAPIVVLGMIIDPK